MQNEAGSATADAITKPISSVADTEEERVVRSAHNATTDLMSLPKEVLSGIASRLGSPRDVSRFGATCRIARSTCTLITNVGRIALKEKDFVLGHDEPTGIKPAMTWISLFPRLQSLDLSGNHLSPEDNVAQALPQLTQLRVLNLSANRLLSNGAEALAATFQNMPNLKTLNLSHNLIGQDGARALARGLPQLKQLLELNLCFNELRGGGAETLAATFPYLTKLETLSLSGNEFGSGNARALAEAFQNMPALKTLNLSCNEFDSNGAAALAVALTHLKVKL